MPIIRYADALLLFAEAENQVNGGPDQAAVDAVNQIINRATGGVPNATDPLATTAFQKMNLMPLLFSRETGNCALNMTGGLIFSARGSLIRFAIRSTLLTTQLMTTFCLSRRKICGLIKT